MAFDPRNILVIDFGQLGDIVMSLPALRAIRERFLLAQITIAVGKPGKELLNLSGYANEILEVDRVSLRDGPTLVSIGRILKFVSEVRKKNFDFVIDLHSYYETNILGFLSGAPHRLYSRRSNRSCGNGSARGTVFEAGSISRNCTLSSNSVPPALTCFLRSQSMVTFITIRYSHV